MECLRVLQPIASNCQLPFAVTVRQEWRHNAPPHGAVCALEVPKIVGVAKCNNSQTAKSLPENSFRFAVFLCCNFSSAWWKAMAQTADFGKDSAESWSKKVFFLFLGCMAESTAGICWQVGGVEPGLLLNSMWRSAIWLLWLLWILPNLQGPCGSRSNIGSNEKWKVMTSWRLHDSVLTVLRTCHDSADAFFKFWAELEMLEGPEGEAISDMARFQHFAVAFALNMSKLYSQNYLT